MPTHATDIVAYTYQTETLCPTCIRKMNWDAEAILPTGAATWTTEDILTFVAERIGVDRFSESSFDSFDFPKVVFADQISFEDPDDSLIGQPLKSEACDHCGKELL